MKKRINIMLSEEALATADESGNRSEYIEQLILGAPQGESKQLEVVSLKQLNEVLGTLLEPLLENYSKPVGNKIPEKTIASPTANTRTQADVLADITRAENERDSTLEFSQDPDEHRRVIADCEEKTNVLWAEWKELKNAEVSF